MCVIENSMRRSNRYDTYCKTIIQLKKPNSHRRITTELVDKCKVRCLDADPAVTKYRITSIFSLRMLFISYRTTKKRFPKDPAKASKRVLLENCNFFERDHINDYDS